MCVAFHRLCYIVVRLVLCPAPGMLHSAFPAPIERFPLVFGHPWLEDGRAVPVTSDLVRIFPYAYTKTGKIGRPKSGGFRYPRALDGDTEHVCLELHQETVGAAAAVDA